MTINEESSFLQGVESRLDSLFADDTKSIKEKNLEATQPIIEEVAVNVEKEDVREIQSLKETSRETDDPLSEPEVQDKSSMVKDAVAEIEEDIREIPPLKEISRKSEVSSEPIQTQDKSSFISEIEKRFSAIFGDDDKNVSAVNDIEKPEDIKIVSVPAGQEESKSSEYSLEDISLSPSDVLQSPLKNMKSIVLSLEWEINDRILEQLEDEISKLYLFYTGDRIIQGFLRIIRFVGRYIRVRGSSSNQASINLLLSVYNHLENVMVGEGMTEAKKHIFLIENIQKYRSWVENTDLENPVETQAQETNIDEIKPLEMELSENKFPEEQKVEEMPFEEIRMVEEKPFPETVIDKPVDDELPLQELEQEAKIDLVMKEQDIFSQTQRVPIDEIEPLAPETEMERAIAAMKDLPPYEAFAYALDELKRTFQTEIDALKEEIRQLRNAG